MKNLKKYDEFTNEGFKRYIATGAAAIALAGSPSCSHKPYELKVTFLDGTDTTMKANFTFKPSDALLDDHTLYYNNEKGIPSKLDNVEHIEVQKEPSDEE